MRAENNKTQRVETEVENFDNPPTPADLGVPADATRVLPCWSKIYDPKTDTYSYRYGYTYE